MRYLIVTLFVLFISCSSQENTTRYSFYHWKSKAEISQTTQKTLKNNVENVYLRYFDIDYNQSMYASQPKYVLTEVDDWYKDKSVIPVVYITNNTLLNIYDAKQLAKQIKSLVNEISTHHFGKSLPDLQIDCDWTERSKTIYFELLNALKEDFNLSTTIRLHQLKYKTQTGIPPVNQGVLMVYNVGELSDMTKNSILDTEIVNSYISDTLNYPMTLDVALPLFSQTVIKNNKNRVRLLNFIPESITNTSVFNQTEEGVYIPKRDSLYHGFFLSPNYQLKTETVSLNDLKTSLKILKTSQLNLKSVIYYHLDDDCLNAFNLSQLPSAL